MKVTLAPCGRTMMIALLGWRIIEHPRQLALEFCQRHVAAEQFLIAGARRPCHIEMRGTDAGEEIEHPLPVMVVLCCLPSLQPPVFIVTCETTLAHGCYPARVSGL